jgi:hypothetical protein
MLQPFIIGYFAKLITYFQLIVVSIDDDVPKSGRGKPVAASRVKPRPIYRNRFAPSHAAGPASLETPDLKQDLKAKAKSLRTKCQAEFSLISTNSLSTIHGETDGPCDGLPEFAKERWPLHFLPTLYACLGSASDPWKLYKNGSSMVATIQDIVDVVYPNSGYRVRLGDRIFTMVRMASQLAYRSD